MEISIFHFEKKNEEKKFGICYGIIPDIAAEPSILFYL